MTSSLSPEAQRFAAELVSPSEPTDFEDMARIRAETRASFEDGSRRAIERHQLVRSDVRVGGVECEHIESAKTQASTGTMLYLFGGAFMVGDPFSDLPIIGALAERCSIDVIAPKYRLAPEWPAPAAAEDCLAVYRAMIDNGTAPTVVAGESAGGNLALVTTQSARDLGLLLPDALALLSPAADLRTSPSLFVPVADQDPTLTVERVGEVDRAYVAGADPTSPHVSPLFGSMDGLPPTIITTGTRDLLMPMCLRTARAMHRAAVTVDLRVWDGLWHVFEFYDDYPEAAESLAEIAAFLNRYS